MAELNQDATIDAVGTATLTATGAIAGSARIALVRAGFVQITEGVPGEDCLGRQPEPDLWLVAIAGLDGRSSERLCAFCVPIAERHGARVILLLGRLQIDLAGSYLLGTGAQLLCDPSPDEFDAALRASAITRRRSARIASGPGRRDAAANMDEIDGRSP